MDTCLGGLVFATPLNAKNDIEERQWHESCSELHETLMEIIMIRRISLLMALYLLAFNIGGCVGTPNPCEGCIHSRTTLKHVPGTCCGERRTSCVIDGRELNCQKDPAECPECAKHSHSE